MPKYFFILLVLTTSLFLGGCTILGRDISVDFSNVPLVGQYLPGSQQKDEGPVNLSYWSLFEPYQVYESVIVDYQNQNSNVTVDFEQRVYGDLDSYKDSLLAKLQTGETTPDIMRIHITWVEDFLPYLANAPSQTITASDFEQRFYKPAYDELVVAGEVYGVPLMYDSLALVFNKSIFASKNAVPPSSWSDFSDLALQLTEVSGGNLVTAGAAVGSADNVAHFSDILGLLINQSELVLPDDIDSERMSAIITFYTNFVTQQQVWDRNFAYSPLSFAQGRVGMIFAPSWQLLNIIENNPDLDIGVAPVPQLVAENDLTTKSYPNFWVEVVNKNSTNPQAAWQFLQFLSSPAQLQASYANADAIRAFGEPYPDVSLQDDLVTNPFLKPYYSYPDNGEVLKITDLSGNTPYTNIFKTVVEGVLNGEDVDELLLTAKQEYIRLQSL